MSLKKLKERPTVAQNKKLAPRYQSFQNLLNVLETKGIPTHDLSGINENIQALNDVSGEGKPFSKQLRKSQMNILKIVREKYKWVPKNYYRTMWMPLGMGAFGVPLGAAFGAAMGNMAFLGSGLPIGMAIGIFLGIMLDKKAKESGNQLDVDIRY